MSLMKSVYQAFINQGMSPNQARIMTAEVGRENDFQPQYIFGRHVDASNKKVNVGMISWQGSRGKALDKRLQAKGLIKGSGIVRGQAALDEMAGFLVGEIKTNPAYAMTKKLFLNNPNVSYDVGKKVLGNNFIRWDYSGKAVLGKNVGKHHAKRDKYYAQLGGQGGTPYQAQSQQPQQPSFSAPSFRPASELKGNTAPSFSAPSWNAASTLKGAPVAPAFKAPEWQQGDNNQPTAFSPPEWQTADQEVAQQPIFQPPEFMPASELQVTNEQPNTMQMPELEPQEWQT